MNAILLQNVLFDLAALVAETLELEKDLSSVALPFNPNDQLRWIRTRQQAARDIDAICEGMVVLLRRSRGAMPYTPTLE